MLGISFEKAVKRGSKLRMALVGPSGSGKTYTSLAIGTRLGGRVVLIDTEHGSARKFADLFDFDTCSLDSFHPQVFIDTMKAAQIAGYGVIIVDSLSHAWMGTDGALALVDKAAMRSQSANKFTAWRDVTPLHNSLVEAILQCDAHVIVTMRAKTEYVMDKDDRGRTQIRKVGLAPVQRDGIEYEFDLVADIDHGQNFIVSKSRCAKLTGAVVNRAGEDIAIQLRNWLTGDEPEPVTEMKPAKPLPKAQERKERDEEIQSHDIADSEIDLPPEAPTEEAETEAPVEPERKTVAAKNANDMGGVAERVDGFIAHLRKKYRFPDSGETYARLMICREFGVESVDQIDNAKAAQVGAYCKGQLLTELRGESFIPLLKG